MKTILFPGVALYRQVRRFLRRIEKRATRGTRFALACRAMTARSHLENHWDMTEAEHNEFERRATKWLRDYARLQRLGAAWGYRLP